MALGLPSSEDALPEAGHANATSEAPPSPSPVTPTPSGGDEGGGGGDPEATTTVLKTPGFEFPATPDARLRAVHQMFTEIPLIDG